MPRVTPALAATSLTEARRRGRRSGPSLLLRPLKRSKHAPTAERCRQPGYLHESRIRRRALDGCDCRHLPSHQIETFQYPRNDGDRTSPSRAGECQVVRLRGRAALRHAEVEPGSIHALVARTAPASPRWSRSSPGSTAATGAIPLPRRGASTSARPPRPRPPARRDLPGADALPRPVGHREHLHGPPAARRGRPDRPGRDVRRGRGPLRAARRRHRPPPSGAGPLDRRPADHRDRQGHLARRPGPDHGRADRGAERRRGRAALHRRPQPARRGPGPGLHLPPLRRGLRALRHRHRDARRRLRRHRRVAETTSTRSSR